MESIQFNKTSFQFLDYLKNPKKNFACAEIFFQKKIFPFFQDLRKKMAKIPEIASKITAFVCSFFRSAKTTDPSFGFDPPASFNSLSNEEISTAMQGLARIDETKPLSLEELEKDFPPKYKLSLEDTTFYVSDLFQVGKTNPKSFVFVIFEVDGIKTGRFFYQSQSQGIFRTLYTGFFCHYGKGIEENDVNAPISLTLALLQLKLPENSKTFENKEFFEKWQHFFIHPIPFSTQTYLQNMHGSLIINKSAYPLNILVNPDINPKKIRITENEKPDFEAKQKIKRYQLRLDFYHEVTAVVIPSKDNKSTYLFYEIVGNRVFLAACERTGQKIAKYGNFLHYPKIGKLGSPLIEYKEQIQKKHKVKKTIPLLKENNLYDWNWNFIREIPLIQEYYQKMHPSWKIPGSI